MRPLPPGRSGGAVRGPNEAWGFCFLLLQATARSVPSRKFSQIARGRGDCGSSDHPAPRISLARALWLQPWSKQPGGILAHSPARQLLRESGHPLGVRWRGRRANLGRRSGSDFPSSRPWVKNKTPQEQDQGPTGTTEGRRVPKERNEVWDACVEVLGYGPLTRTECKLWGQTVKSLAGAGADRDMIVAVAAIYRKRWPNMTLSVTALEKWYSHFRAEAMQRSLALPPCPQCGVGGGLHSAECVTITSAQSDRVGG